MTAPATRAAGAPWRVLIVDDDFMVARIHARFVENTAGFEVVGTAHTGADALARALATEPTASTEPIEPAAPAEPAEVIDIVLLDVHLPDLSGLEVLARLRAAGSHVAVVMVTAERGAEAVRAAVHGGAQQYLVKPFAQADLADRLRRVADGLHTLASSEGPDAEVDQATIDAAFGAASAPTPQRVPKGLSPETADLVLAALRAGSEHSATEIAETVGLSRVTARRYLEWFVETGAAAVRLQYGSAGRPERRYRIG